MTISKLRIGALGIVILGCVSLLVWQQQRVKLLNSEADSLRQQIEQSAMLKKDHQTLSDQLKTVTERSEADKRELMKLRAEVASLRQTEQELVRLKVERDRVAQQAREQAQAKPEEDHFDREYGPGSRIKVNSSKFWAYALLNYAVNHQGQFPTSLEQAAPFLAGELSEEAKNQAMQAGSGLEILHHGLMADLESLPPESTIVIRELEPWVDAQGKWCKAYGMADGHSEIRRSNVNDFEKWESIRIPKARGQ